MPDPQTERAPPPLPPPSLRPPLHGYARARGLSLAELGAVFGKTGEWARLITLPFDDPRRRVPAPDDVARAFEWSCGEITPADWYPPELSQPTATAEASS